MPFTPRRPWEPLSDAEWDALRPHLRPEDRPGPPLVDPRARMDAILHMAVTDQPWRLLPERWGKGATVGRHFRRLAHGGLWSRLLEALADPDCPRALSAIAYWLCRAARRAMRLLQMAGITLARRLRLYTALPMLPWLMPDPDLSELVFRDIAKVIKDIPRRWPGRGVLRNLGHLLRIAGGRPVWSKRFAPP
ncbi:transposase [Paracraurococcus lichenis]|uniref:Transposase n=1 Tax=Paracraurococcus lichenis TaxID=3064888 RepID=A0ABT9DTN3_9PROT|nr:transposase [Paracraurococcus sp. LOR1-02]MDO9707255.1 transposase [Paracraurococcus sp. LOR1-02]